MRIFDLLIQSARQTPDNRAAVHDQNVITYKELYIASLKVADSLKEANFPPGSRVAIFFENSIDYIIAYFAIFKAGMVAVPLDTSLTPEAIASLVNDCQAKAIFYQGRFRRSYPAFVKTCPTVELVISDKDLSSVDDAKKVRLLSDLLTSEFDDSIIDLNETVSPEANDSNRHELAAIFYTSGSTGTSKGVMLSHLNLVSNTLGTIEYLKLKAGDSVIVILPFYYIYGNSLLLTHVACGGTLVIDNRFMYPEVILDTMEAEKVTGFSGVPSNFMIMLNKSTFPERELPALRYFTQAGGAMAPEVIRRLADSFPTKEIFIMYGQTEASPRVTWLPPEKLMDKMGSIGIPVPGVTVELLDDSGNTVETGKEGEIVVSGDSVMMGYWNHVEEESKVLKEGKLFTGDLARQDEDGAFYIVGRKKEIIKSGGNRVSAKEVEECLLTHGSIAEVAVFGMPDDLLGEAIKAAIVLKQSTEVTEKELKEFCRLHLADQKVPKFFVFIDELPKYQSGKINKPLLKTLV